MPRVILLDLNMPTMDADLTMGTTSRNANIKRPAKDNFLGSIFGLYFGYVPRYGGR